MQLKLSLIQQYIRIGEYSDNFSRALSRLEQSVQSGCQLAVLPELWSTGYDMDNLEKANFFNRENIPVLQELSDKGSIAIAGTYILKDQIGYRNRFLFIRPKSSILYYDKIHLFPLLREFKDFTPGNNRVLARWRNMNFHLATCYDLRFPEHFRISNEISYFASLIPAQWPQSRLHHWVTLLQARAIENQCFAIAVNGVSASGNITLAGNSLVVDPFGVILNQGSSTQEETLIIEIDTDQVHHVRNRYPFLPN